MSGGLGFTFGSYSSSSRKRTLGRNDRDILYMRAKGKCEGCGKRIMEPEMQVGHIRAFSKGGATTLANSACLCTTCNKLQGTGTLTVLKKKMAGTYGKRTSTAASKKATKTTKKKSRKRRSSGYESIFKF